MDWWDWRWRFPSLITRCTTCEWAWATCIITDERDAYAKLEECGRVAQLVEQRPFKAWVAGSNPAALTIHAQNVLRKQVPRCTRDFASRLRRRESGSSSNPAALTIFPGTYGESSQSLLRQSHALLSSDRHF